uniref:Major sperm protein n=1 Tax=Panagrellus redivivus TaxID=6233 RepID=A0A7E4W2G4_PANRE
MPSRILINFADQRKVYDTPYRPIPWTKSIVINVGNAPTVDVFYKGDTQNVRVKTFKFKTLKERHVSITVAVDGNNTVTAKLVTLDPDEIDDTPPEPEIIFFSANGESAAFTRTSEYSVFPPFSEFDAPPDYVEDAVLAAATAVPPSRAAGIFISPLAKKHDDRRRLLQLVEAAGYTNIYWMDTISLLLTNVLSTAKPKNKIGDQVGVVVGEAVNILRKTDHGYDLLEFVPSGVVAKKFPGLKKIFHFGFSDVDTATKYAMKRKFKPFKVEYVAVDEHTTSKYIWNRVDGRNLGGYLVTATTQCQFRISYKGVDTTIDAMLEPFPWQDTVELDIGYSPEVNVYMKAVYEEDGEDHVKQFKFETKENRKVVVTISIDESRLPKVELVIL